MEFQTALLLIVIGLMAGIVSGLVGLGGGIIVVPALVFILGMSQHEAQGTSLFLMLPPIGILAAYTYYRAGHMNIAYGSIIAITFVVGGLLGAKLALRVNENWLKLIFGAFMIYVAVKLFISGWKGINS